MPRTHLLIPKLKNISIVQTGESVLTIKNALKRIEPPKVPTEEELFNRLSNKEKVKTGVKKLQDEGREKAILEGVKLKDRKKKKTPKPTLIDLGSLSNQLTVAFHALHQNDNNEIMRICKEERETTFIDKYKGFMKIFVTNLKWENNETHINRVKFTIEATVVPLKKGEPLFNYPSAFKADNLACLEEMKSKIVTLGETAVKFKTAEGIVFTPIRNVKGVIATPFDKVKKQIKFFDDAVERVNKGLNNVLKLKTKRYNSFGAISKRINNVREIFQTLSSIVHDPIETGNVLGTLIEDSQGLIKDIVTFFIPDFYDKTPLYTPEHNGQTLESEDLSQIDEKALLHQKQGTDIANLFTMIVSINDIIDYNFNTTEDFNAEVNDVMERVNHCGLEYWLVESIKNNLRGVSNEENIGKVYIKKLSKPTPLIRIVFNEYGNLDYYYNILNLNNPKDADYIENEVKMLAI